MCGIVAYVGTKQAGPILLEGLRRLEYRGYDSAGLSVLGPDMHLSTVKKDGKLKELEGELLGKMPQGFCGIAHTRWATHGRPHIPNAHPHVTRMVIYPWYITALLKMLKHFGLD